MKKILATAFCLITICAISVMVTRKAASASASGYNINNYLAMHVPAIEGNWTPADEWTDAEQKQLDGSLTAYFRLKWTPANSTAGLPVYNYLLIDFLNDTTDDAADEFGICIDAHHNGGTSPQTDDYMIKVIGHSFSGFHVYQGNGTGWNEITSYHWPDDVVVVNDINPSPNLNTPHWIAEFRFNASWMGLLNNFNIRVAAYDASSVAGNNVWPNSVSADPSGWGTTTTNFTQIPEFPVPALVLVLFAVLTPIIYRFKKAFAVPQRLGS